MNPEALKAKIFEFYPELERHGVSLSLSADQAQPGVRLTMAKGEHTLSTHLETSDVESCLRGAGCASLGIQIGRFVEYYCLGRGECPV